MKPRIVADENIPGLQDYLGSVADIRALPGRDLGREQLVSADALLVRSVTRVDAGLLKDTAIRFVGTATSGFDHIDVDWLAGQGIAFCHAPGSNANSVVEYVLAAMAECNDFLERLMASGRVGIVGYGHIGRALSHRLAQLQIEHCIHDPWLPEADISRRGSLDEVLACDVISLHPALIREPPHPSEHLLGQRALGNLHGSQLLINASRGPVVDNRALLERLGQPGAPTVVLDVWEREPRVDARLLEAVRLGSAHIAGYSLDGKLAATAMLAHALADALALELPARSSPPTPPLKLDAADSAASALRSLLAQRYRVADDDRRLRGAVLGLPADRAADNFDQLRKHYPVRRELAGSRVTMPPVSRALDGLVRALGATPEEEGEA